MTSGFKPGALVLCQPSKGFQRTRLRGHLDALGVPLLLPLRALSGSPGFPLHLPLPRFDQMHLAFLPVLPRAVSQRSLKVFEHDGNQTRMA